MKKKYTSDIIFILFMVELYIITIIFYELNLTLPQNITLLFLSVIFVGAVFSFLSGLLVSLYLSLFFVATFGSFLLYTGIINQVRYNVLYYVFLIVVPIFNLTIGSYSSRIKKTEQAVSYLQQRIDNFVTVDPVTGLDNITAFNRDLMKSMSFSKRSNTSLYLLIFEIKYYEELKAIYKASEMEQILKQAAARFKQVTRLEDNKYRISDHMFAVILANIEKSGAESVKEKLREQLNEIEITKTNGNVELVYLEYRIGYNKYGSEASSLELLNHTKRELVYDV